MSESDFGMSVASTFWRIFAGFSAMCSSMTALSAARVLLTMVDRYREEAEQWVSAYLGHPVKIGALDAQITGAPTAEQAQEMAALQAKLGRVARVVAWHLVGAVVFMAARAVAV